MQKWFEYFRNQPYEVAVDKVIEEAEEILDRTHWTREEKQMYDQRTRDLDWQNAILAQAEEDGFEKGVERGLEQGIEQGIYQVALTMLKQGFELPIISSATGLSETDIQLVAQDNLI